MNGEKKDFCILSWSGEDIKVDNVDLKLTIQSDAPAADVHVVNLSDLRQMGVKDLKSLLDGFSEKTALIISSSEEAEDMDFWKLGFIMGKVSIGKARIIGFVKGDQTSCFQALSDLLLICKNEIEIKREIKNLMKDLGIETKFDLKEYTAGKIAAETEEI
ncbi:MAG TPA: hypothetical protein VMW67_01640 [Desulfobacteria bacterium]|nr:hypothetical protein [Desulfobacteria bacterium]